jgi:hypothetical protein
MAGHITENDIAKGGRRWFILMLPLSIVLTIRLYMIDRYLAENEKEQEKGELLRELRTAQSSFDSVSYDGRQGTNVSFSSTFSSPVKTIDKTNAFNHGMTGNSAAGEPAARNPAVVAGSVEENGVRAENESGKVSE